jgi:hypothetical protein
MRILLNEVRKILTLKMLLLLLIVNSILYFLLIEFYIEYFPNGRPGLDSYHVSIEMLDKYGIDIDEEEFVDFKKTYEGQVREVNQYLQSRNEFVDAGFGTYDALRNYDHNDNELSKLSWKLRDGEDIGNTLWELQSREYIIDFYESGEASLDGWGADSEKQKIRIDDLKKAGKFQVYPDVAFDNFKDFIFNVAIAILLSVVIIISPTFIKDRSRQMLDMQYTTKKGRNLYKTKAVAGLISTFVVITTLLIVYFSLYSLNNTSMFFEIPIHKFFGGPSWYDPTFFQYIVLTTIAIYILGFVSALFAMSFSSIVPNYISLIGVQVPYVFLIIALGINYLVGWIISIYVPQWVVPTSYIAMLVVSNLFIVFMWKREKKRDIVI